MVAGENKKFIMIISVAGKSNPKADRGYQVKRGDFNTENDFQVSGSTRKL